MGGGLTFLNKKTWHPGRMQNQEDLWKRQQAADKEAKKLGEIKKQIEEERQKEEMDALAVQAGVKKLGPQMDWMYQGGMVARAEAEKRQEEQLTGAREVQPVAPEEPSKVDQVAALPSFYAEDTPASANEIWLRLHSDPLFAIKQQEIAARKSVAANPLKMDAIKREVAALQRAREERRGARRQQKEAQREARREAKQAAKQEKKEARRALKHAASNGHAPADERAAPARRRDSPPQDERRHAQRPAAASGRSVEAYADRREQGSDRHGGDRSARERSRHEGAHAREEERDRREAGHGSGRSRREEEEDVGRAERGLGEKRQRDEGGEPDLPAKRPRGDGALAQGAGASYGLSHGGAAPAEVQARDRAAAGEATRRRLAEAERRAEAEAREAAAQRYVRREHRTGQLSAEERAARLAEMAANADDHAEARSGRLRRAAGRDAAEAGLGAAGAGDGGGGEEQPGGPPPSGSTPAFLRDANLQAFGDKTSMADRVGRRKHYNDRSGEAAAFRR